ncbi:DUF2848 domain-containing protein [Variovorax sp. PAMC26660]|uniref:DUF2848 domain-containing protein n=1 Tax=Variovorax sp. PAMC26660 TaxID=2762322 RepID=UPI00164DB116|nr:DUF2848 domain-containing protein [Variovorax sp. PAMC26660]QNK65434.1 DUF2848 domain-containing protein [Variovorax sp. PAMC26660]
MPLRFACETVSADGARSIELHSIEPTALVVAGWTGRDTAAIEHHIEELAALGVPRPSSVPLYYRVAAQLLTQSPAIEALGDQSSGEAEPVFFFSQGEWWLSVASDHTDRHVESYSVAVSKQMCAKPVAEVAWRWRDVQAHQDEIELHSRIFENGRWVDYQRGTLASIRPLAALRDGMPGTGAAPEGLFMTCGTLGALPNAKGEGIRPAAQMEIELHDPRLQRRIVHRYAVEALPVVA